MRLLRNGPGEIIRVEAGVVMPSFYERHPDI